MIPEPTPKTKGRFQLDDGPDVFEGWHDPNVRWNGFATPAFELETAMAIGRSEGLNPRHVMHGDATHYNASDAVVMDYSPEEGELDVWCGSPVLCDDGQVRHLYAVGAFCWVWFDV